MALRDRLRGGSPRSLGAADAVAAEAEQSGPMVDELVDCLLDRDEVVRMRAADALEKVARHRPEWVSPHVDLLLGEVALVDQASVRWHLAQILAEIPLEAPQRDQALVLLRRMLTEETDWIVLTCTMTSLTDLCHDDPAARSWLVPLLQGHARDPRPAVAKRARAQAKRLAVDLA